MQQMNLTYMVQSHSDWHVAWCPELDIASQGKTVEEARRNLIEALELFFEMASPSEIEARLQRLNSRRHLAAEFI